MNRMCFAPLAAALALSASAAAAQTGPATLSQLHDALRLSAEQDHAWQDYLKALQPTARMQARHAEAARLLPRLPTPRRIALIQADRAADEADFVQQGEVITAFYGSLTLEQQIIFDRQTAPPTERRPGASAQTVAEPDPPHPLRTPPSPDRLPAP